MVTKVIMPKFGLSMETGVLGSWLVEEGASVTKGSALAEITTDKITNTCEAPKDGILRKILLPEGGGCLRGGHSVLADTADEDISAECGEARVKGALLRTAQSRRLQHPLSRKRPPRPILKSRRGPKR